jgi:hypothetical protein
MFDLNTLVALNVFGLVGFGIGFAVGHRGWVGTQSDLSDVKEYLAHIKGTIQGSTQTATPPVVVQPVTVPDAQTKA